MKKWAAGLLFLPAMASAEYMSGNMLYQRMTSTESFERAMALGYVLGVSDVGQNVTHCSGSQVTSGQTRDVVKQYLEQNPAFRDMSADVLVVAALGQAFPCAKNQRKGTRS